MDEYIYKDEAFVIIENKQREICPMGRYSRAAVYGSDREAFDNWQEILDEIDAIKPSDVAPVRHGRWIEPPRLYYGAKQYECSLCYSDTFWNKHSITEKYPHCPNCGAKMDGELNE